MSFRSIKFADLPIGAEFWWGGWRPEDMNWGRKRSSRTADYRPNLSGKLIDHTDWAYWGKHERVYISG